MSVTENLEKDQILGRMPHNLVTLDHLMGLNDRDFRNYLRAKDDPHARRTLKIDLKNRRRKAVTLVEELSIRTQKVQPLMRRLEQVAGPDARAAQPARRPPPGPRRQGGEGRTSRRSSRT